MKGIYRLWIIDPLSGINYVDAIVKEIGKFTDGDLISGLFTALNMFSENVLSEKMTAIETESYRILFDNQEKLILAFLTDINEPSMKFRNLMKSIAERFVHKYPEVFEEGLYVGKTNIFFPFKQELEELLESEGMEFVRTFDRILEHPEVILKPVQIISTVQQQLIERQIFMTRQVKKRYKKFHRKPRVD